MCSDSKLLSGSGFFLRVWLGDYHWNGYYGTRQLSVHSEFSCHDIFNFFQLILPDKEQTPTEYSTETSFSFTFHCFRTYTLTGAPEMNFLSKISCFTWLSIINYQISFLGSVTKNYLELQKAFLSVKYVGIQSNNSSTRVAFEKDWDRSYIWSKGGAGLIVQEDWKAKQTVVNLKIPWNVEFQSLQRICA